MKPVLVVAADAAAGDSLVAALRRLGRIAICVDACESALEMTEAVDFAAVLVNVDDGAAWAACGELARAARCPVVVVTAFLARDRRYRRRAFNAGISAYVCRPCTIGRLRALLARLSSGETAIELTEGSEYSA
jgi:DNA-binding response OmpR family regulator